MDSSGSWYEPLLDFCEHGNIAVVLIIFNGPLSNPHIIVSNGDKTGNNEFYLLTYLMAIRQEIMNSIYLFI
jgi:hypothetical protein